MAAAPAPLTDTPTPPIATASDAAMVRESILAASNACTEIAPRSVVTSASAMKAETSLLISLYAPAMLIDTATPTPPNPAARLAAPVTAEILDVSSAFRVTLPVSMSVERVP